MTHEYSAPRTGQPDRAVLLRRRAAKLVLEPVRVAYTIHHHGTKSSARTGKSDIFRRLAEARERTRFLLEGVSKEDLARQHDPVMSPLSWDYGHIGSYEELWLLQKVTARTSPPASSTTCTTPPCTRARNGRP